MRSTEVLAQTLHVRGERNHQIPLAGAVQYAEKDLPIHPYVLGVWLGDGTSTKPEITTADEFVAEEIRRCGYSMEPRFHRGPYLYLCGGAGHTRDEESGRFTRNESFSSTLRNLALLGNKHIPEVYLRGSVEQRTALLHGLMDSDGYVGRPGALRLHEREVPARGADLTSSWRAWDCDRRLPRSAPSCTASMSGPKYEVQFTPDRPVFRLPRKLARQKPADARFHRFRAVTDIRVVPPVPVRCIEVANPSGQFLVTRSYIATHNSSLGRLGLLIHSTAGFVDAGFDGTSPSSCRTWRTSRSRSTRG